MEIFEIVLGPPSWYETITTFLFGGIAIHYGWTSRPAAP